MAGRWGGVLGKALRFGFSLDTGCTILVLFSGATTDALRFAVGALSAGNEGPVIAPRMFTAGKRSFMNGAMPWVDVAPNVASGVLGVSGQQGYYNGGPSGGALTAYTGAAPTDCGVGDLLFVNTGTWQGSSGFLIQAISYYHAAAGVTPAHVAAITARMLGL